MLRGKHRPSFSPHQLCGDHVIILNAAKLSILPAKAHRKMYYHHTGYLGHLQTTSLEKMMEKKPEDVLQKAVKGMLPSNRLKPLMLKRLHIFKDDQHPYAPQKPLPLDLSTLL
ncbi:50S ribosomal protein L13 [Candidatus Peregrinibacteria bacterium]|nr:50S ribosomal protein L13 [Candidatus Peregrinibacteria bacterium]